jgi:HD-like signal output (HDOD) protein
MPAARLVSARIAREWRFPDAVCQALTEQVAVRKGAAMSSMGRLLAQVDYLCKVKILAEQGKVSAGDEGLFDGLPADVRACYAEIVKTSAGYH